MTAANTTSIGMTIAAIIRLLRPGLAWAEAGVEPVRKAAGDFEIPDGEDVADEGFFFEIIEKSKDWEPVVCVDFEIAVKLIVIIEGFVIVGTWPDNSNVGESKDNHDSDGVKLATI